MVRIVLVSLLSGIVLFAWGMLAWMVFPIHDGTLKPLPEAVAVVSVLKQQRLEDAYYVYPAFPENVENQEAVMKEFEQQHKSGPIFSLIYHSQGTEPMPPAMMGGGLLINLVSSFIAVVLLSMAIRNGARFTFFQRFRFVALLGVFAAVVSYLALKNWMYFPGDFTNGMILDLLISWILAGIVIAALIKPATVTAEAEPEIV